MTILTFPAAEADFLTKAYAQAKVILEYGSGGSTKLAASQPGKLVFSVESDLNWARRLQQEIDADAPPSPAILYPVDIGPTGEWGRPLTPEHWHRFHHYPLSIWEEPFFRHPDLVLIDGRFRTACFLITCLKITKPVTLLFDDYVNRPLYHQVEEIAAPVKTVGRMAQFDLTPGLIGLDRIGLILDLINRATYAKHTPNYGDLPT